MQPAVARARRSSLLPLVVIGLVAVGPGWPVSAAAASSSAAPSAALPRAAAATADGRIAYVRHGQIVTVEPDGTGETVLTSDGRNVGPSWSPDGSRIAFVHGHDLWVMDADGAHKVAITSTGRVSPGGPSWSPDGGQLAFGGPCTGAGDLCNDYYDTHFALDTIAASSPDGVPTTLVNADGEVMEVLDRVSWSSAGDEIAYASSGFASYPGDEFIVVYQIPSGEGELVRMVGFGGIYGNLANPAFSPDGELIAYDAYIYGQPEIIHRGIAVCDHSGERCGFRDVLHDSQLAFAPAQDRVVLVRRLHRDRLVLASPAGTDRERLAFGSQPSWQRVHAA